MACGLPVVATRCGGPESFVNQENGILCSINDVSGMAEALLSIINNYNQYNHKEIADNCQRRFGAYTIAHQLTQIFEETIKHFNK
jgi:glycosyltransferase involved in cell wall biosynthesis